MILDADRLRFNAYRVYAAFVGSEYWTQDNINSWFNTAGYAGGRPHVVVNTGFEAQEALRFASIMYPACNIYVVVGPQGTDFDAWAFNTGDYVFVEGYDYQANKDNVGYVGATSITASNNTYFYPVGRMMEFNGVTFSGGDFQLVAPDRVLMHRAKIKNIGGHSNIGLFNGSGLVAYDCVFEMTAPSAQQITVVMNSAAWLENCRFAGINNVQWQIFYADNNSSITLAGTTIFEGTPMETCQGYWIKGSSSLTTNGASIPGVRENSVGTGSSVE